jgi:lipoate-protein ligase A
MSRQWQIAHVRGSAAVLHATEPSSGAGRCATRCDVDALALVLGSAQRDEVVDLDAVTQRGAEVVRRRSGGGAVLIVPGEMLWLDVVVPRGDPLWDDDIGRAMWWLGEAWADALVACGVGDARVHRGAVVHTPWSRLVCWDSLGAGEVVVDGRKAVGISQRRTRDWIRLQSSVHLAWRPELLCALLAGDRPEPGDLGEAAVIDVDADRLWAAIEARLSR